MKQVLGWNRMAVLRLCLGYHLCMKEFCNQTKCGWEEVPADVNDGLVT